MVKLTTKAAKRENIINVSQLFKNIIKLTIKKEKQHPKKIPPKINPKTKNKTNKEKKSPQKPTKNTHKVGWHVACLFTFWNLRDSQFEVLFSQK